MAHGIRMGVEEMREFATSLHCEAPQFDIYIFGYDWTRHIEESGDLLFEMLERLPHSRIVLVGYSMGGLVARLAASRSLPTLDTVITVATPNRGAISTAQLAPLGQSIVGAIRYLSPMFHCPGVMDLTRADEIMLRRRGELGVNEAVATRRYVSIPALYFHPQRAFSAGRSQMASVSKFLERLPFTKLTRPHDGIVTEDSNNLVTRTSTDWDEMDYASYDGSSPARCHAVHVDARDLDHSTVLESRPIARLVARLAVTLDWSTLRNDPDVRLHFG
jgi:pimeloyl-ACP methyl ester carboxylesterase